MSANGAGTRLVAALPTSPSKAHDDIGEAVLAAVDLAVRSKWGPAMQRAENERAVNLATCDEEQRLFN